MSNAAPAFNIGTCSEQDYHARLAIISGSALEITRQWLSRVEYSDRHQEFARHLNRAMGYRAEHRQENAF